MTKSARKAQRAAGQAARPPPARPRGRDAVTAALLDAAAELFANRPYNDVTMREIATAASVNFGLLHRHFGTKSDILHSVIQRYADRFRQMVAKGDVAARGIVPLFADKTQARFLRTLAYGVLSNVPMHELIASDGAIRTLLGARHAKEARETSAVKAPASADADLLTAFALLMGWSLFAPFLVEASGRRVGHAALRKRVFALATSLSAR